MSKKRRWKYGMLAAVLTASVCVQSIGVLAENAAEDPYGIQTQANEEVLGKPENISVQSENGKKLMLTWDSVKGASTYILFRSEDQGEKKNWTQIGSTNDPFYEDQAEWGKTYFYQIQSAYYDAEHNQWLGGGYSDPVSGELSVAVISNVTASVSGTSVKLAWSSEGAADVFGILRSEDKDGSYQWITAVSGNEYTDSVSETEKTYYYKIYAAADMGNGWENGEKSEPVEVYVENPYKMNAPQNVRISNTNDKGLTILWDGDKNATAYVIYRLEADGSWKWLNVTSACDLFDDSVKMGETAVYKVQSMRYADGKWENGPMSDAAEKQMIPAAPVNLSASAGSGNQAVNISWTPAGTAGLYGILRSDSPDGDYTWIGASQSNHFTDAGLTSGKSYYYKVYAAVCINDVWYNGEDSAPVKGGILEAPVNVVAEGESLTVLRLSWDAVTDAIGYMIWRLDDNGNWQPVGTANQTEYIDTGLNGYRSYQYKIQSLSYSNGVWGYGGFSEAVSGQPEVGKVQDVTASPDKNWYYGIHVGWRALHGVSCYGIMRAEHGTNDYQWIAMTSASEFLDLSGNASHQYDYKVYAAYYDGVWHNGANSDAATAAVREWNGAPAISDVQVQYVNGDGYLVTCTVASPNRIASVVFPSWTSANGQDDIVWKYGTVNGNQVSCWIYPKEHGYQIGQYETCIYAYDTNGKYSGTWAGADVPVYNRGTMTGWYDTNSTSGERYYLNKGQAVTGWHYVGGLKFYFYSNGTLCQNVDSLIGVQKNYKIKVNKQANCVTIYASDGANGYVIPVKSMLCSTGDDTPLGTFYTPAKYRWQGMFNGTYAQFATRLTAGQGFLFHSITYSQRGNNHSLLTEGYNGLGVTRSAGCIRLLCGEAYWIYTRCPIGTQVEVYNSSTPGPFYRPVLVPIPGNQNYDPTDPFL